MFLWGMGLISPMEKKTYSTPELQTHGSVEALTLVQNKTYGPNDGFTFQGDQIANAS